MGSAHPVWGSEPRKGEEGACPGVTMGSRSAARGVRAEWGHRGRLRSEGQRQPQSSSHARQGVRDIGDNRSQTPHCLRRKLQLRKEREPKYPAAPDGLGERDGKAWFPIHVDRERERQRERERANEPST